VINPVHSEYERQDDHVCYEADKDGGGDSSDFVGSDVVSNELDDRLDEDIEYYVVDNYYCCHDNIVGTAKSLVYNVSVANPIPLHLLLHHILVFFYLLSHRNW
jgi:hypothetical protein